MSHIPPDLSFQDAFFFLPPEVRAIVVSWFYSTPSTRPALTQLVRVSQKYYAHLTPELDKTISLDQRSSELLFYSLNNGEKDPREEVERYCEAEGLKRREPWMPLSALASTT
ncbi:hypothetical protein IAR50_003816 [Cryptococcus sp. DSM 104548]